EGGIAIVSAGAQAPPAIDPGTRDGPDSLRSGGHGSNHGVIASYDANGWEADVAAMRSAQSANFSETAVLDLGSDGSIASSIVRAAPGARRSAAAEARVARRLEARRRVAHLGLRLRPRPRQAER